MNKLLSANLSRLWRDKTFLFCGAGMLFFSLCLMLYNSSRAVTFPEFGYTLDQFYFSFAAFIGAVSALLSAMYLGPEYSDGGLRNKLVVGHRRRDVYLANFITVYGGAVLLSLCWMLGGLAGIPTLGLWEAGVSGVLLRLGILLLFLSAFSAIFTCVGMLSSGKAPALILSLLLFLALLLISVFLQDALTQPETISPVVLTVDGIATSEPIPNPNYVPENIRPIYEFFRDVLPTGQGLGMAIRAMGNPVVMAASSLVITLVGNLFGLLLFQKKNLK